MDEEKIRQLIQVAIQLENFRFELDQILGRDSEEAKQLYQTELLIAARINQK